MIAAQDERQREIDLRASTHSDDLTQAQSQIRAQDESLAKLRSDLDEAVSKIKELNKELSSTKKAMAAAVSKTACLHFRLACLQS